MDLGRVGAEQTLVFGVGHLHEPILERLAARGGEHGFESAPPRAGEHLPAGGVEHALQPADLDVGDDPVERLAVEIDDPHDLAEAAHLRIDDRLPYRPFVHLRVAEQGVEAAGFRGLGESVGDVAVGQRRPDRGGRTDAHGSGREVHRVRVLRPGRIGLESPTAAQRIEEFLAEVAEQIVDRVEHRRSVRFDRDAVDRAQPGEPQRRHDPGHRGRRGLMAADLDPVRVRPPPIGAIDDRRRQPQHPLGDLIEDLLVAGGRGPQRTVVRPRRADLQGRLELVAVRVLCRRFLCGRHRQKIEE